MRLKQGWHEVLFMGKGAHHIPDVVGDPVNDAVDATDDLQMLSLDWTLVDQKEDKTCRDKRHGTDDEDGYQHVWTLLTETETVLFH